MNLFVSTATDKIYLMTFNQEKIIKKIVHQGNNDHTQNILILIEKIVPNIRDIKKIFVVNGPGSYTGLRVSMIVIKTICIELDIDLYACNLLECLYYSNNRNNIAVDAKGKKHYTYDGLKHLLISNDELDAKYLVDPLIDLDNLYKSDYFDSLKTSDPLTVGVNYVKDAL